MNHLSARLVSIVLMTLWMVGAVRGQATQKPQSTAPRKGIYAAGCVQAGVEAGCLVVSNPRNKTTYNLLFKGKKPAIGSAIRFTGVSHDGPTSCMQGEAIDVKTWTAIKMKCSTSDQK
ncbi:MAG TPA: hypothetical protein VI685_03245 [Candidatus Angelobacter sp.]